MTRPRPRRVTVADSLAQSVESWILIAQLGHGSVSEFMNEATREKLVRLQEHQLALDRAKRLRGGSR